MSLSDEFVKIIILGGVNRIGILLGVAGGLAGGGICCFLYGFGGLEQIRRDRIRLHQARPLGLRRIAPDGARWHCIPVAEAILIAVAFGIIFRWLILVFRSVLLHPPLLKLILRQQWRF